VAPTFNVLFTRIKKCLFELDAPALRETRRIEPRKAFCEITDHPVGGPRRGDAPDPENTVRYHGTSFPSLWHFVCTNPGGDRQLHAPTWSSVSLHFPGLFQRLPWRPASISV